MYSRPITPSEVDAYDELARRYGTIFDTLRWTDMFGTSIHRLGIYDDGGTMRGGFCVWEQRKLGLRLWRNPPYTPQVGPFFEPRASNPAARTDEQRSIIEAMSEYLEKSRVAIISLSLSEKIADCLPFIWRKWKVTPGYTYRISLCDNTLDINSMSSKQVRKHIRNAKREGLIYMTMEDPSELLEFMNSTYQKQNLPLPQYTNEILNSFKLGDQSYGCVIRNNQNTLSIRYVIHDNETAYALMSGHDIRGNHNSAGVLATWKTICMAREKGLKVFDFEGSMIPSIERYYRGFGGTLTPIFSVHKAWLPIEMALKLHPKYRSRF